MKNNNLTSPQRQRSSVAIQGIDKSTPDDLVQDGKCEVLHNMRYKDGAWRPVRPFMGTSVNYTGIVYHHPVAGYILFNQSNSNYTYTSSKDTDFSFETSSKQRISHFGNILIFESDTKQTSYIYADGKYKSYSKPISVTTSVSYSRETIAPDYGKPSTGSWQKYSEEGHYGTVAWKIYNCSTGYPSIATRGGKNDDYWVGEIAYFIAFRMADGTEIRMPDVGIISSEDNYDYESNYAPTSFGHDEIAMGNSIGGDKLDATYIVHSQYGVAHTGNHICKQLIYILPTLTINLPSGIDTELITSVALYATRIYPMLKYTDAYPNDEIEIFNKFPAYSDTNIVEQPFFLIKEYNLKTAGTKIILDLTADLLLNSIDAPIYTPNNNEHASIPELSYDYNNRRHLGGVIISPTKGRTILPKQSTVNQTSRYTIKFDNTTYVFDAETTSGIAGGEFDLQTNLFTYPDYRAKSYYIAGSKTFNTPSYGTIEFKSAVSNNLAYYTAKSTATTKYPTITMAKALSSISSTASSAVISLPNKIMVSSANNCFSFPFENTYAVGSSNNKIITMQSAAIKIGDEQVGALPLYVFTEEGIFALRAGESTLYAAINPINYDKIINPSTLTINGAIAYITEQGVHLLTPQGAQVISSPIHKADGMPDLEFLKSCVFLHSKQFDEFMIYKETDKRAYVYNISQGYWSTRDVIGSKINTDELVDNTTIYDLNNEDESKSLSVEVTTRPIKLGNVEFKRLETIIPRMATNDHIAIVNMDVAGSVNGTEYMSLRSIENMEIDAKQLNPIILRRTPFSAKYFKYHMKMEPEMDETFNPSFTHIDFEWYTRYVRRMR